METQWMRQVTRKRRRTLKVSISRTPAVDVVESQRPASCNERGAEAPIRAEQLALMESTSLLEIYRTIGTGNSHCAEQSSGAVFVCLNSLTEDRKGRAHE